MERIELKVKSFKKMEDPTSKIEGRTKYVCYVQCSSIPSSFGDWMGTNPREQKMTTNVAKRITESLENNLDFHELNRGIVISAKTVLFNNKTNVAVVELDDPEIHGNIDGGHTLRAILDAKHKNTLAEERYVFMEIFTGISSPVDLAEARNTAVQVDLKSIEELKSSFDMLKTVLDVVPFKDRVQYKMNEHYNDDNVKVIDVREILSIIIMFSKEIYPVKNASGTIGEIHPIQCYSGKEASLRKFLNLSVEKRRGMLEKMQKIIPSIFNLWNVIEKEFASKGSNAGKRYGTRKYSRYDADRVVAKTNFYEEDIRYFVPKGLMYPLVGAFRALIDIDFAEYQWKVDPLVAWNELGPKLVSIILDEQAENPDVLAKNSNLWSNLFKEMFIYAYLQ